jgi:hypothetical protein
MADRRRYIWPLLAALLTCVALLPAAPAPAQEDGVTVDPDSPSGREYDIPTERARREAGSRDKERPDKGDDAPLFGQGVGSEPTPTPSPPVATPTAKAVDTPSAAARKKARQRRERAAAKRKAEKRREAEAAAASGTATPSPTPPAVKSRVTSSDTASVGSWAPIGGIFIALVVAGTTGGLVLRRRFSSGD